MFISLLFNPLRQIADKFNVMQMGIVAADRVFEVMETNVQIQDFGTIEANQLKGDIELKDVHFSYLPGEGTEKAK